MILRMVAKNLHRRGDINMKLRNTMVAAVALSLAGASSIAVAQSNPTTDGDVAKLSKQIKSLQTQTRRLSRQLRVLEGNKSRKASHKGGARRSTYTSRLGGIPVMTSPYLGAQATFNADNLLVMVPSVNEDLRLLHFRKHHEDALKADGIAAPEGPYVKLSGMVEGQVDKTRVQDGSKTSNIDLSEAEINVLMGINSWATGYFSLDHKAETNSADAKKTQFIYLKKAFLTLGNLQRAPVYMTLGETYVPFGRYASAMVSSPLTLSLARTHERAVILGYSQPHGLGLNAQVFAFRGNTTNNNKDIKTGGVNVDYVHSGNGFNAEIGASYMNNFAETDGMQASTVFGKDNANDNMKRRVAGVDVHGKASMGDFAVIAEYVSATRRFDSTDLIFNGAGAKPSALNVELGYNFKVANYASNFAIGYGQTKEAMALGLAKKRYIATFNTSLFDHTVQSLEFSRNRNYNGTDTGNVPNNSNADNKTGKGGHTNQVLARFAVYF